jgi:hypothetical protein
MTEPVKIMVVLKDKAELGRIDVPTGRLTSSDPELTALYQKWETEGFQVLGPPATEPPPGVCADCLYTIKPGPGQMGLVAFELSHHGYDMEFE